MARNRSADSQKNPTKASEAQNAKFSRRTALAGLLAAPIVLSAKPTRAAVEKKDDSNKPDAIVIGAGSIGCNTAWHLKERGERVLVIEAQEAPASQSTTGAAGFVASWAGIHNGTWKKTEWEMERYGIDFYTKLAKRSKVEMGFSPCGITYIYVTPDGWKHLQPKIALARKYGTTVEILTAERAKELTPFIEFSQVAGIAFDPDAVRVRAGDAIRALAEELAKDGVQFRYSTRVTDLIREGDKVVGIRTGDGEIRSDKVIVTAGAWSRPLLEKAEVKIPTTPFNETRYVTKPLPGLKPDMPLLIFTDHMGHYIREEKGGLLIGGGDTHPLPADREIDAENPPASCSKLPPDQAYRVRKFVEEIKNVMPVLGEAEIDMIRSGMPTLSPDHTFVVGPAPDVEGLFLMSGCMEAGITHGPAMGRILSEYALDGKTKWDVGHLRVDRFKT